MIATPIYPVSQNGTVRRDGGPPYTAPVMLKMTELFEKGLVTIAFDRAGTSNTDPRDAHVDWSKPDQVAVSQWFDKYIAACKQAVRALQPVCGTYSGSVPRAERNAPQ